MLLSRAWLAGLTLFAGVVAGACNDQKQTDACGDALPMEGSLCTREGQECLPDETGCGLYSGVRCSSGMWVFFEAGTGTCTGGDTEAPLIECGEELPPEGTMCEREGLDCAPGKDLCAGYVGATCMAGRWKRYEIPPGDPEACKETVDCAAICPVIVAAKCAAGPADDDACLSECAERLAGNCDDELSSAVTCGGEPPSFTCDAADRPTIADCAAEFEALYACLG